MTTIFHESAMPLGMWRVYHRITIRAFTTGRPISTLNVRAACPVTVQTRKSHPTVLPNAAQTIRLTDNHHTQPIRGTDMGTPQRDRTRPPCRIWPIMAYPTPDTSNHIRTPDQTLALPLHYSSLHSPTSPNSSLTNASLLQHDGQWIRL